MQLAAGLATAGQPTLNWEATQTLGQTLAALETGDNPRCGKDGACNLAVCSADGDPDCRDLDLPPGAGADSPTTQNRYPSRPSDVIDCTSKETSEMAAAIDWGAENWQAYEAVLEDIRDWPVNIGNCLESRFQDNGKVVCESSMKGSCTSKDGANNGWASFANKKCHTCPDFLDRVRKLPDPVSNRQACYFALVSHEWGHTCERGHKVLEIVDDEAFNFWKSKHPDVTISFGDCGMR